MKYANKIFLIGCLLGNAIFASSNNEISMEENSLSRPLKRTKVEETFQSPNLCSILNTDLICLNILGNLNHHSLYRVGCVSKSIFPKSQKLRDFYRTFEEQNDIYFCNEAIQVINEIYEQPVSLSFIAPEVEEANNLGSAEEFPDLSDIIPFLSKFTHIEILKIKNFSLEQIRDLKPIVLSNPIKRFSLGVISLYLSNEAREAAREFAQTFSKMENLESLTLAGLFDSSMITPLYQRSENKKLKKLSINKRDKYIDWIDDEARKDFFAYTLLFGNIKVIKGIKYLFKFREDVECFLDEKVFEEEIRRKGTELR